MFDDDCTKIQTGYEVGFYTCKSSIIILEALRCTQYYSHMSKGFLIAVEHR